MDSGPWCRCHPSPEPKGDALGRRGHGLRADSQINSQISPERGMYVAYQTDKISPDPKGQGFRPVTARRSHRGLAHTIAREKTMSIELKLHRALSAIVDAKADLERLKAEAGCQMQVRRALHELDGAEFDVEIAIRELSGETC